MGKTRLFFGSAFFCQATMVLAAICFNNWFLAVFLNNQLLFNDGAVSEFSAAGQPHAILFRSFDVVSGILFLLAIFLLARHVKIDNFAKQLFLVMTAMLAIANIFDALLPLSCSQTFNSSCILPVNLSLSHFQLPSHAYSSILIALSYFLLPLSGWLLARGHPKEFALKLFSGAGLLAALLSVASVLTHYLITGKLSVKGSGISQELQMLLLGSWFIFCYNALLRDTDARQHKIHKPRLPVIASNAKIL